MTESTPTGVAIRQSFGFLRRIHKDTYAVTECIDMLMARRGWYPTLNNRITGGLTNGSNPEGWLVECLWRFYVNNSELKPSRRCAGVEIMFNPPSIFEEPVCLCTTAEFSKPIAVSDIWNIYEDVGARPLVQSLQLGADPEPIRPEFFPRLYPGAISGKAFVVRLCDLSSEAAVHEWVVARLIGESMEGPEPSGT